MKILALEFSSDQRSVAVVENGRVRGRAQEIAARGGRPLFMVESALREAGLEREQVDCLAVALGPGSYAGIRSAIALAQGWQLALGTKTVGVSSVECLAARAQAEKIFGRVGVVIDAQRGEFYLAVYEISDKTFRETEPLRLAARADVDRSAAEGVVIVGPEATKWFPAGRELYPGASVIGQLAATRSDFVSAAKLEPIYLRETSFVKAPPPRIIPAA
jgi:tRNA threonylcarbamoyl adenosine modification protein YeaZ